MPPPERRILDMHRPSRARRILKWTGAGLSLLILASWSTSQWLRWQKLFTNQTVVLIDAGYFRLATADFDLATEWNIRSELRWHWHSDSGFGLPKIAMRDPLALSIPGIPFGIVSKISIPFWLLLLLTAAPTAWHWHRDRRGIPPGHCPRCGYDLTGNTSSVCSECGEACPIASDDTQSAGRGVNAQIRRGSSRRAL